MTAADPPPTPDDVRRIAALGDPVLRNLEITHAYARLAAAVAAGGIEGANWCTYATWASRQAGSTIRGEDLQAALRRELRLGSLLHPVTTVWRRLLARGLFRPHTRLGRLTAQLHTPFDAFERASAAVARGNLKVFAEIGLEFARYLEERADGLDGFLARLRPGEPPDGQRLLRQAFERYERARREPDPRARAQLTVLANLEIGLHEQTRLDPEIREALDAATATHEDLGRRTLAAVFPVAARRLGPARGPLAAAAGALARSAQKAAATIAREAITESLMVLSLPGRALALGAHLADEAAEPLRGPADADLTELLSRFEPAGCRDCGARDWSALDQRMHYLVHLFRAFHLRDELARPPFTAAQVAAFRRGEIPAGDL